MPQAVTHILVPILIMAIIRDFYLRKRDKKHFPLHYVMIAGIGGVLPDIDFIFFLVLGYFGFAIDEVHRTITHTFAFPLFWLALFFIVGKSKTIIYGKHKLKINVICLMLAFGTLTHIMLDGLISGYFNPLYPFGNMQFGLNLMQYAPKYIQPHFTALVDGILLVIWLVYLEWRHKISDFI